MKALVVVSLACTALSFASCKTRQYNKSEPKGLGDVERITADPDGKTFTVTCKTGVVEKNVTQEQIKSDKVCKGQNVSKMSKIDARTYNSFMNWKNYDGTNMQAPITSQPPDYWQSADHNFPRPVDNIFAVEEPPKPTAGTRVEDGHTLIYPATNPQGQSVELRIRFFVERQYDGIEMPQVYAARDCEENGARLPTAQELTDFCLALDEQQYKNSKCGIGGLWSVTRRASKSTEGWMWDSDEGRMLYVRVNTMETNNLSLVENDRICVGAVK